MLNLFTIAWENIVTNMFKNSSSLVVVLWAFSSAPMPNPDTQSLQQLTYDYPRCPEPSTVHL